MTILRLHRGPRISQVTVYSNLVFVSGQVTDDEAGGIADQTKQVLARINGLLHESGSSKEHLLLVNIWLASIRDFDEMNIVWDRWVAPQHPPARATVETRLLLPTYLVEMSAVAAVARE